MADSEGLTDREVGAVLIRLDMIQEMLKGMDKLVRAHENSINRMRGALWIIGVVMPVVVVFISMFVHHLMSMAGR